MFLIQTPQLLQFSTKFTRFGSIHLKGDTVEGADRNGSRDAAVTAVGGSAAGVAEDVEGAGENTEEARAAVFVRLVVGARASTGAGLKVSWGSEGDGGQGDEGGESAELHFECCKRVGLV